jgi:hemolysin activation/secretion protein
VYEITHLDLVLGQDKARYVAPREGLPLLTLSLDDLKDLGPQPFHYSAIQSINGQIVAYLNGKGLFGVLVAPDTRDIALDGTDLRPSQTSPLRLVIRTAIVSRTRTLASRYRAPGQQWMDHPSYDRIKENSPIQPAAPGDEERRDLLRKDLLDDYLFRLNRHPNRRVDVSVRAADEPNHVTLDYLISEKKPWILYFQTSNTGTEETKDWRWRLGYVHNQLTNNDDILSLDYITTDFSSPESRGALLSYEAPLFGSETVRWSIFGSDGKFESSDVGLRNEDFDGKTRKIGAELYVNAYQHRDFFLDLIGGARWEDVEVNNDAVQIEGDEELFLPYLGCRFERWGETASTAGRVTLEWTETGVKDLDKDELTELGRLDPDTSWQILKWRFSHAFFLEPWLDREAWEDVSTPGSSTLAHELFFSLQGQYTFGNRVIPQHQGLAGGAYSVRGYPDAAASADTTVVSTLEYRFHWPRTFEIEPDPSRTPLFGRSFRFAPQQIYGRPDWDLVLRSFIDYGRTVNADRLVTEKNETLVGAGVGVEVLYKENISIRADWGVALNAVLEDTVDEVESGDQELHLTFTVLF